MEEVLDIIMPYLIVAREWLESEGVRRNALRVKCPNSPHYEDKHEHRTKD